VVLEQLDDDLDLGVIVLDGNHSQYVGRVLGVRVFAVLVGQNEARVCLLDLSTTRHVTYYVTVTSVSLALRRVSRHTRTYLLT